MTKPQMSVADSAKSEKKLKPHVYQRDAFKHRLNIREFPWTDRQKEFIELIQCKSTTVMLCKGPAGTAKTMLATYGALTALNTGRVKEIAYIRNPVESSSYSIGFLKGDYDEKMKPYLQPLMEKLQELLTKSDLEYLLKSDRIMGLPLGFLRGTTFNSNFVIIDEAQNLKYQDLLLVMTRLGKFSKMILCGDTSQTDIKGNHFDQVYNWFDDPIAKEKGIHTFEFGLKDIVRSPLLSFIIERFNPESRRIV